MITYTNIQNIQKKYTKIYKNLGINLTKEVKDLYVLTKDTRKDSGNRLKQIHINGKTFHVRG